MFPVAWAVNLRVNESWRIRFDPCTILHINGGPAEIPVKAGAYAVLVAVAFSLILLNALYGHHVYGSPYGQALAKYSVYVHLQPGWSSAPANILYDVTVSWNGSPPEGDAYNSNHLVTQRGREAVVLQHGFSDCSHGWSPPLYRYGADMLRSHIRHAQGLQLNTDPYVPHLPDIHGDIRPDGVHESLMRDGYAQFIPVCGDGPSFMYSVSVNDQDAPFDVYFVPSAGALDEFLRGGAFPPHDSCGASNRISHTGSCGGAGHDSGLLIILPDTLDQSLTRVSVSIQQSTSSPGA